ncbi:MAG: glycosyl transferase family 1 [Flavobacteriales bacterium]|nr:glycosyl transferase family 1 [Flavobacteriales bacterium]
MNKIKNRDIVVISPQAWDGEIGSNCRDIARELAKHNRVLYINRPMDWATYLKSFIKKNESAVVRKKVLRGQVSEYQYLDQNLTVFTPKLIIPSVNFLPDGILYDQANRKINAVFSKEIQRSIAHLGFSNFIIFNDSDMFRGLYLKELLHPQSYIYYSRDNLVFTDYYKKHGPRIEPILMAKSDLCVANSEFLAEICKKYNPHSYDIGQGVDLTEWDPSTNPEKPKDLEGIKGPIIGYVGALLAMRLDIELLERLASAHPQWNFVLVGPQDNSFIKSKLHQLSNVFFIGSKRPEELPAYVHSFDVCVNPQIVNEMTVGNYPRKIDEYLAMGKPVVATNTPTMQTFLPHVFLANNLQEYSSLIKRAIDSKTVEEQNSRRNFALSHNWGESVRKLGLAFMESTK